MVIKSHPPNITLIPFESYKTQGLSSISTFKAINQTNPKKLAVEQVSTNKPYFSATSTVKLVYILNPTAQI